MPTIAIYVPAATFRRLNEDTELVRDLCRRVLADAAGLGSEEMKRAENPLSGPAAVSSEPNPVVRPDPKRK